MSKPTTVNEIEDLGRTRLSKHFLLRDFLFSDVAAIHGLSNVPDYPDLAITAGTRLCEELLEPLQDRFGRIGIRSAYRSCAVDALGKRLGEKCARNEANYAAHIWDRRDEECRIGTAACVVVPAFWDVFQNEGDWQKLAWWIHDQLPYSSLYFFPKVWAMNTQWRYDPERRIDSYTMPRGCLTKAGMPNHTGSHEDEWPGIKKVMFK